MENLLLMLEPEVQVTLVLVGADPRVWQSLKEQGTLCHRRRQGGVKGLQEVEILLPCFSSPSSPPLQVFSATWTDIRNPPLLVAGPKYHVTSTAHSFSEKEKSKALMEEENQSAY